MANVLIDIAAEFTGNKAFKQAETSTEKLTRNVKKLAGAVGLAFSATAIVNFGKLAVKASLDQQAEQHRLNQLLKVGVGASTQEVAILNEQAAALEKIGVVTGGNITQTQSQLATFNLQVSTIQALTPAILDYVTAEKGATASTADFKSMTNGLAQALNGNFASLTRVGFVLDENTKKQIANGTEAERANALVKVLNSTYKDFNKNLRDTDAGKMQVLSNAAQDATTIIGTGLLDALKGLGEDNSVDELATNMQNAALYTADVIRGIGVLTEKLKSLPVLSGLNVGMIPILGTYLEVLRGLGRVTTNASGVDAQGLADLARLQSIYAARTLKTKTKLTAEEKKALSAAKLKLALEKANLALLKGEEVFDMDKIQIAAALTNQAEQLGKATSSAQVLQIANDTARLNVKQSILALEDAIAAKDEAAITAATKKLNEDLKILGVLSGQNVKLQDIKSILDSLKPKDLINLANLDAAIAKMMELLRLQGTKTLVPTTPSGGGGGGGGGGGSAAITSLTELRATTQTGTPINFLLKEHIDTLAASVANVVDEQSQLAMMRMLESTGITASSTFDPARFRARESGDTINYITVQAGVGDPNAIAEAIDNVLREARDRGTLTIA
jgi:hypothetical protein